jgi:hypothetical protein
MAEATITCPNCSTNIPLTESLAAPLLKATKAKYEQALAQKDRDLIAREETVRAQQAALEQDRATFDEKIAEQLDSERKRIVAEEAAKAKRLAATELEAKTQEIADLNTVITERDGKLAAAQKAQAEVVRKERELDDARREMDLTIQTKIQAELGGIRDKAKQEAEHAAKLPLVEKEEQIASMQRQIEELKRKAEQGSQQSQGEAQELHLEALLRAKFTRDVIEAVPKGEFGGDVLQRVMGPTDQPCGVILWESKRTKNFSDPWLAKLREDQRKAGADVALMMTNTLPKGVQNFELMDGIWVTDARCAIPVAVMLRHSLISIAAARKASEGQQTKMELMYQYLTGPGFRHRVGAVVERFVEMQSDLERERRSTMKQWAKRDQQMRGVVDAMAGMVGDLQGIAGKAIEEIEVLTMPLLENGHADNNDDGSIAA